jgi:hypothetical protein
MNDEYLWNRTGEPDPETVRLETLLGPLQYSGKRLADPQSLESPTRPRKPRYAWWLAAAAVLVAGFLVSPMLWRGPATEWRTADGRRMRTGQTIETSAVNATIQSSDTGEVTIGPGSRFRLVHANDHEQRFELQLGVIHASIWAPPGQFVVDTPSSKTVDLGCSYTLQVSKGGTGLLTVEMGWVAFERNKVESFIPAGAACVTRPGKGPGTPYFGDAPEALINALGRFDVSGDPAALDTVIAVSTRHDALSLWHLMVRTRGEERGKVFDRLSALVKLPPEATRQAVLQSNGAAMDAAWNALDLGNTDWWRGWKRQW